jgi:uncharacterized protein (TIGR03066 family)
MITRSRFVIAGSALTVLVVAAALWFTVIRDRTKPPTEQPKTTAQLLVGSWEMVLCSDNEAVADVVHIVCAFTEGGRFEVRAQNPIDGLQTRTGRYLLEGNKIRFTAEPFARSRVQIWDVIIESITDERFVTISRDPEFPEDSGERRCEYRRLPSN